MSSLKFGTSGLRGLVCELPDEICAAYVAAFLIHMRAAHGLAADATLLVGYDLRASSPRMAAACMAAATNLGLRIENCGPLPTPALAMRAQTLKMPAVMVTGSHIPADRNGLKFYRPDGEIDKVDEAGITAQVNLKSGFDPGSFQPPAITASALQAYFTRCVAILKPNALSRMRIGVYQHSSVARDLMLALIGQLGAEAIPVAYSDVFVPVDTEALRPEDSAIAKEACATHKLDALISTDGDADRPLVADENGAFFRGDILGLLTARFLTADAAVTPVTSSTAVELTGLFKTVVRTRVGSPFVIEGMHKAAIEGAKCVVGFEANGGVLLGSDVKVGSGSLAALPTRDAMLPILAVLGLAAKGKHKLSHLLSEMPARFTQSGRIEHVGSDTTGPFLASLLDPQRRGTYFHSAGLIEKFDNIDGIRVVLVTGDVIHYRASGNAPELRCYTESASLEQAARNLEWGLAHAKAAFEGGGS